MRQLPEFGANHEMIFAVVPEQVLAVSIARYFFASSTFLWRTHSRRVLSGPRRTGRRK